ncbi:hypothetical protein DMB38_01700 [Streptomyces sp. WAC 06738]|uniref:hypothetical protein n=1 Tax=Streptomyces sp. WAC 06738 TaxID=2203210 RepID=UPI000F715903|nr:hypothetical protein [Streptomyces sp. WAC 06738]AZM44697.1 hypothetical protein DMB38_01700 [Streptomyces sp. WAC 06738]
MGDGRLTLTMVDTARVPPLLALAALVVTFLVTRGITRMIRAGRGPFRNVDPGGMHIHHVVPGVVLMVIGGFGAVFVEGGVVAESVVAVVFGMGTGLVLDEFALIVHLHDVYWSEQGRASVEVTVLTTVVVGMVLIGSSPFDVDDQGGLQEQGALLWSVNIVVGALIAVVSFAKGKFRMGVLGVVIPLVGAVGAIRLARPASPWAHRFYARRPHKLARATRRAARHDARWSGLRTRFQNAIAGAPSPPQQQGPDRDRDRDRDDSPPPPE